MSASEKSQGYRSWRPGDGTRCSLTSRAAEGFPCGPPVLTQVKKHAAVGRRAGVKTVVICENHVASRFIPGGLGVINAQAEREAREAVLTAHWDEYQKGRGGRMSVETWQRWLALFPCERCGWAPDDCWCKAGVPASAPPPKRRKRTDPMPVLTLEERRAAYAPLHVPVLDVIAAAAAEQTQGRGAA